jgi:cellulose synthase/poly-beta-1,6-N-acetylglucosamine synthase-like glycosyltransferase
MVYWLLIFGFCHIIFTWVYSIYLGARARHQNAIGPRLDIQNWPSVSVIIPAWQERLTISSCVQSLRKVCYPSWEIILVAGGQDGTYEFACDLSKNDSRIRVIEQLPIGKNAALNTGYQVASGDVIVLLDCDSQVEANWLHEIVRPLVYGFSVTTGNYYPVKRTLISLNGEMEKISTYLIHKSVILQGSGSIAVRREMIEILGGFPVDVHVGVDWDLNARISHHNWKRIFSSSAKVYSYRPATLKDWWKTEIRWRRAHFSSLFRLRDFLLNNVGSAISNLYFYTLAWFSIFFTLAIFLLIPFASRQVTITIFNLWGLFIAWLLLRRVSLAFEVAVYTKDIKWLRLVWVPPILLILSLIAGFIATITSKRLPIHFKGPRKLPT